MVLAFAKRKVAKLLSGLVILRRRGHVVRFLAFAKCKVVKFLSCPLQAMARNVLFWQQPKM